MSDEESLNLEDVGAGADEIDVEGRKAGFIPSFLIKILKYAAIALGFIILGVTTTVVTYRLISQGRQGPEIGMVSPEYQARAEPYMYDDSIESIRGVTADETPAIFSLKVSLGDEERSSKIAFELNARRRDIQNIIFLYISQKHREELAPKYYQQLQDELMNQINRRMKEGKIKQVVFSEFVVTQ